jgi:DNA-directed RNA polymerase specialized sigma subunit
MNLEGGNRYVYGEREQRRYDPLFERRDALRVPLCAQLRAAHEGALIYSSRAKNPTPIEFALDQHVLDVYAEECGEDGRFLALQKVYSDIVSQHRPLARAKSRECFRSWRRLYPHINAEQLQADAEFALFRAAQLYDVAQEQNGVVFSDYAGRAISNRLTSHLRKLRQDVLFESLQPNRVIDRMKELGTSEDPESVVGKMLVEALLYESNLTRKQKEVITTIYYDQKTLVELAAARGVTPQAVDNIRRQAIRRMRNAALNLGILPD